VLLARYPYTLLYPTAPNVQVVHYRNGFQATLYCWRLRLFARRFDALVMAKGFGPKTEKLCRLIPARRKISSNPLIRTPEMEYPEGIEDSKKCYYSAWRALKQLDPDLPYPQALAFPPLMQKRAGREPDCVVICPVSEEERRCFTPVTFRLVVELAKQQYPERKILLLVRNEGELARLHGVDTSGTEVFFFRTLDTLIERLAGSAHYFGADTGLLHIALAMGIPATVFFGPCNSVDAVLPGQPKVRKIRLAALGDSACSMEQCLRGDCIERAARNLIRDGGNQPAPPALLPLQDFCPLKNMAAESLAENADVRQ
jgi:ADP-heptose:LPS heptosyltransferase